MKHLLITFSILLSFHIQAETIKLAIITSEFDKNITDYYVITNAKNEIEGMRYVTILPNGGIDEDVTLSADQVIRDGAVIFRRSGHDVFKIKVEKFSLQTGGVIVLDYLYSAVTGARNTRRVNLVLENGEFHLFDLQKTKFNRMFMKVNWSRIFGAVGIREIKTSLETEALFNSRTL